jgi:hypothetical protein
VLRTDGEWCRYDVIVGVVSTILAFFFDGAAVGMADNRLTGGRFGVFGKEVDSLTFFGGS